MDFGVCKAGFLAVIEPDVNLGGPAAPTDVFSVKIILKGKRINGGGVKLGG